MGVASTTPNFEILATSLSELEFQIKKVICSTVTSFLSKFHSMFIVQREGV